MHHRIQIVTLKEENQKPILKVVGFIHIKDKTQITFNPSIDSFKKGHWTWHKDGKVHFKNNTGHVLFKHKSIPLGKFKGQCQFLFTAFDKDWGAHLSYTSIEDSSIFLIDLRQFTKCVGFSVYLCDYHNVNKAMHNFIDKPHHQSFVYWMSTPKIVVIAFDN